MAGVVVLVDQEPGTAAAEIEVEQAAWPGTGQDQGGSGVSALRLPTGVPVEGGGIIGTVEFVLLSKGRWYPFVCFLGVNTSKRFARHPTPSVAARRGLLRDLATGKGGRVD